MSVDLLVYFTCFIIFLYLLIVIKLVSVNSNLRDAFRGALVFPWKIINSHVKVFFNSKSKSLSTRFKMLLFPIVHPAEALVTYATAEISGSEFQEALRIAFSKLDDQGKQNLLRELLELGILKPKTKVATNEVISANAKISLGTQEYLFDSSRGKSILCN